MTRVLFFVMLFMMGIVGPVQADLWSTILDSTRAIDWTVAGVIGGIPTTRANCTNTACNDLAPGGTGTVSAATINSALSGAPSDTVVRIRAGTFTINGTITLVSNKTLRGAGMTTATGTVLQGANVQIGSGNNHPVEGTNTAITSGATKGSTSLTLNSVSGISVGTLLRVTQNDLSYMSAQGSSGCANWADEGWGADPNSCSAANSWDSGQTVRVTALPGGNVVTIEPALYLDYTSGPRVHRFTADIVSAGLEDIQIYSNGSGAPITMFSSYGSWITRTGTNFTTSADWLEIRDSLHNTISNNYFLDAFTHTAGGNDECVSLRYKSSANLIENNIFYRGHVSVMLEWGSSGNVISYNYATGNYETNPSNHTWFINDFNFHGAHPMFNLFEGNIGDKFQPDDTWGSNSHTTIFRHWSRGSRQYVPPENTRGTLDFGNAVWETQNNIAYAMDSMTRFPNFVAAVAGSTHLNALPPVAFRDAPTTGSDPSCWRTGYESANSTPVSPNNVTAERFFHGIPDCLTGTVTWDGGTTHTIPASFYLSAKPSWFGSLAWPGIGPDITGGVDPLGMAKKNPAMTCFDNATLDATNRPIIDAAVCYASISTSSTMSGGAKVSGGVKIQ